MSLRRVVVVAIGSVLLVAGSFLAGHAIEVFGRPPVRGGALREGEGAGDARPADIWELEDRVVRAVRSDAPEAAVTRALERVRRTNTRAPLEIDRIIERRAEWWRTRIADMPPARRPQGIAMARRIGFTDDELDVLTRTPERELGMLARLGDPAVDLAEARDLSVRLSRSALTPEAASRAVEMLSAASVERRMFVSVALSGTEDAGLRRARWIVVLDPEVPPADRAAVAESLLSNSGDADLRGDALVVLEDDEQPDELRLVILRALSRSRWPVDPGTCRVISRIMRSSDASSAVRRAGATHLATCAYGGDHESRQALLSVAAHRGNDDAVRADAIRALLFAGTPASVDAELALAQRLADDAGESESVRRQARLWAERLDRPMAPRR